MRHNKFYKKRVLHNYFKIVAFKKCKDGQTYKTQGKVTRPQTKLHGSWTQKPSSLLISLEAYPSTPTPWSLIVNPIWRERESWSLGKLLAFPLYSRLQHMQYNHLHSLSPASHLLFPSRSKEEIRDCCTNSGRNLQLLYKVRERSETTVQSKGKIHNIEK